MISRVRAKKTEKLIPLGSIHTHYHTTLERYNLGKGDFIITTLLHRLLLYIVIIDPHSSKLARSLRRIRHDEI